MDSGQDRQGGAAAHLRRADPHTGAQPPPPGARELDLNNDYMPETTVEGPTDRPTAITVSAPTPGTLGRPGFYSRTLRASEGPAGALDAPRRIESMTEVYRRVVEGQVLETRRTFTDSDGDGRVDSIADQELSHGPAPEGRFDLNMMLANPREPGIQLSTSGFVNIDGEPGLDLRIHPDGSTSEADLYDIGTQQLSLPGVVELDPFEEEVYLMPKPERLP